MRRLGLLVWLEVYTRRRRIAALLAFGVLYLVSALIVHKLGVGEHGQVEPDKLLQVGGFTLVSAFLVLGWSIGRFPLIIVLVLVAGLFSNDAAAGYSRLYVAARVRLVALYGLRLALLMLLALALSVMVLPVFDYIILGKPSGAQFYVLVVAYILVFGSLTALFSLFTRADAWAAMFVWIAGMIWHAMLRGGMLDHIPQMILQAVSVVLPPQGALNSIEDAFGNAQSIPWGAFLYVCMYAALILLVAGLALSRKEI